MVYKRGLPKISGSTTGFIALVAILAIIIVGCSVAVVYLVLSRPANQRRRERLRALGPGPDSGHFRGATAGTTGTATSAIREKLAGMFAFARQGSSGSGQWARADGDAWDATDEELSPYDAPQSYLQPSTAPSSFRGAPPSAYDPYGSRRSDPFATGPGSPTSPSRSSQSFSVTSRPPRLPASPPLERFEIPFPDLAPPRPMHPTQQPSSSSSSSFPPPPSSGGKARAVYASESTPGPGAGPTAKMTTEWRKSTRESFGPSDSVYTFESGSRFREQL